MTSPSPERWTYLCPQCEVEAVLIFPPAYPHDKEAICPGCDMLMEVVDYPHEYDQAQTETNVVDFTSRLALKRTLEAIKKDLT